MFILLRSKYKFIPTMCFYSVFSIDLAPLMLKLFFAAAVAAAKSLQSCLTLCDPIDGSPRGSPVLGIIQARTLEWVAIAISTVEYYVAIKRME